MQPNREAARHCSFFANDSFRPPAAPPRCSKRNVCAGMQRLCQATKPAPVRSGLVLRSHVVSTRQASPMLPIWQC